MIYLSGGGSDDADSQYTQLSWVFCLWNKQTTRVSRSGFDGFGFEGFGFKAKPSLLLPPFHSRRPTS